MGEKDVVLPKEKKKTPSTTQKSPVFITSRDPVRGAFTVRACLPAAPCTDQNTVADFGGLFQDKRPVVRRRQQHLRVILSQRHSTTLKLVSLLTDAVRVTGETFRNLFYLLSHTKRISPHCYRNDRLAPSAKSQILSLPVPRCFQDPWARCERTDRTNRRWRTFYDSLYKVTGCVTTTRVAAGVLLPSLQSLFHRSNRKSCLV